MSECFGGLREECGVFGVYGSGAVPAAQTVYLGLFALQHRGQESCGIAVNRQGVIACHKDVGLVGEVPSVMLAAPEIKDYQPARTFAPTDPIPVAPGRGWLLLLEEKGK